MFVQLLPETVLIKNRDHIIITVSYDSWKERPVAVWKPMTWKTLRGVLVDLEVLVKFALLFKDLVNFTEKRRGTHKALCVYFTSPWCWVICLPLLIRLYKITARLCEILMLTELSMAAADLLFLNMFINTVSGKSWTNTAQNRSCQCIHIVHLCLYCTYVRLSVSWEHHMSFYVLFYVFLFVWMHRCVCCKDSWFE